MASNSSELDTEVLAASTKLRRLKLKPWRKIIDVLRVGNRWVEVAGRITKPNSSNEYLYSARDISVLEDQVKYGKCPAEAFLGDWSTTGKNQPTIQDLISILQETELYQAANTLSMEFLKVPVHSTIDLEEPTELKYVTDTLNTIRNRTNFECDKMLLPHLQTTNSQLSTMRNTDNGSSQNNEGHLEYKNDSHKEFNFENSELLSYKYFDLAKIAKNFLDIKFQQGGCKIGEGAFGTVYRAYIQGSWIAIKRLKDTVNKQFLNELEVLTRYKHENLLPLLGYSNDGPHCCLVYAYMKNGSLQERLACLDNTAPIQWTTRLAIACGTARGINHLHTFKNPPLVHRDIKSANVLLDENLIPKVGDFGLARIGNSGNSSTVAFTSNIYGTSVYMAREAFNGEVSVKLDTFSFGVVLLELLTGLAPYDTNREESDLISYMEENYDDILDVLDSKAGNWDKHIAVALYEISNLCIETRKKDRPTIAQVLPDIEKLMQTYCKLCGE